MFEAENISCANMTSKRKRDVASAESKQVGSIHNKYTVKAFTHFANGGPLNNIFLQKLGQDLLLSEDEHAVFPGKRKQLQKDSIMETIVHDLSRGVHSAKEASGREHSALHKDVIMEPYFAKPLAPGLSPAAAPAAEPDAEHAAKPDAEHAAEPDAETDAETDAEPDAKTDAKPDAETDAEPASALTAANDAKQDILLSPHAEKLFLQNQLRMIYNNEQPITTPDSVVIQLLHENLGNFTDVYCKNLIHSIMDNFVFGSFYKCKDLENIYEMEKLYCEQNKMLFTWEKRSRTHKHKKHHKHSHIDDHNTTKQLHEAAHHLVRSIRHIHQPLLRKLIRICLETPQFISIQGEKVKYLTRKLKEVINDEILQHGLLCNQWDLRFLNYILKSNEIMTQICIGLLALGPSVVCLLWTSSWSASLYAWHDKHGCFYKFLHGAEYNAGETMNLVVSNSAGIKKKVDCTRSFADLLNLSNFELHELILQTYDIKTIPQSEKQKAQINR